MVAVTNLSDFGAQENSLSLLPLFPLGPLDWRGENSSLFGYLNLTDKKIWSSTSQQHPRPLGFLLQSFPEPFSQSRESSNLLPAWSQLELLPVLWLLETSLKQTWVWFSRLSFCLGLQKPVFSVRLSSSIECTLAVRLVYLLWNLSFETHSGRELPLQKGCKLFFTDALMRPPFNIS